MRFTLLVVDDEKNIRGGLAEALRLDGHTVVTASDGVEGWERFQQGDIDLVITDLKMARLSGEELLRRINVQSPGVPVIVLTGHGTVENAVDAMRHGAYDFLTKPLDLDRLSLLVKRALSIRELTLRHRRLEEELSRQFPAKAMTGNSPAMRAVYDMIVRVAPSRASVLITGESGVGKELVANALHDLSPRKDGPLVKVNCAAFASTLLESELFGHEKGAFTGALARRRGRFELAHEGTLFLDEIGEIDQNIQVKLLRVLQEKKFERLGGEETIEVDVRIVAATNKDLKAEIEQGTFREDLYYRLNVVNITVPPLRERKDDLPLLIREFAVHFAEENRKPITGFDERARAILFHYDWPGHIRELKNCIESAVVMCRGTVITKADLPPSLSGVEVAGMGDPEAGMIKIPLGTSLEKAEGKIIRETLLFQKGNKSRTADVLGIGRKTLDRKLAGDKHDELEIPR
ncbi:MAG: sigma-54 dependent transcriptional regulator [Spirochaetaceae bacterium]|jgi:DNA-binding NtrC family response regulator|nr:sigma-54 dependent transcriptional regulator [Spirochaetaceae bacterium]